MSGQGTRSSPPFSCRECGAAITADAQRCRSCGCQTPFQCSECGKHLSSVSLNARRSHKHPYGAFSPEGAPLCSDHRITRCHQCEEYFPLEKMKRREVGIHADTNLRHGMKPRMEKVWGHFCPDCYSGRRQPEAANQRTPVAAVLSLVAVGFLILVVVLAAILLSHH